MARMLNMKKGTVIPVLVGTLIAITTDLDKKLPYWGQEGF